MAVRRVLHVIPSVSPLRGGPSGMIRQLAQSLSDAGVEAHIACTNDHGPGHLGVPLGVPVQQGGAIYWYFKRQTAFYTTSWPLGAWLADNVAKYDIVHIHALFSYAALPASFWSRRNKVPYVVRPLGTLNNWGMTQRRPWLKKASYALLESRIIHNAALMHYTSEQERAEAESLGIRTRAAVIPNPVQPLPPVTRGAFRRQHALGDRQILLFLSRVDPKKGIELLLQAFVLVRSAVPNAVLVVAGEADSKYGRRMQALAISLGISDGVLWAGFVSGVEKAALLADADVFVLPSYSENFGIAAAEAMSAGVPVVLTDQVALHRDVVSASAGIVTACSPDQISGAISGLLTNAARRKSMGDHGARFAAAHYSPAAVTQQLMQAYDGVVN